MAIQAQPGDVVTMVIPPVECHTHTHKATLPPPCRSPPLVVLRGGGGVTWSTQNFSLRLIVLLLGDCVVGHYHLHPLHSWQDILLTFAEMEQPCFPLGQV